MRVFFSFSGAEKYWKVLSLELRRDTPLFLFLVITPLGLHLTLGQLIQLIFRQVKVAELDVEECTSHTSQDGNRSVVPDQIGVLGQRCEGLAKGGRKGSHEEGNGLDHGAHVLGCLGVGVLEGGDGGKDLGQGDEDV